LIGVADPRFHRRILASQERRPGAELAERQAADQSVNVRFPDSKRELVD